MLPYSCRAVEGVGLGRWSGWWRGVWRGGWCGWGDVVLAVACEVWRWGFPWWPREGGLAVVCVGGGSGRWGWVGGLWVVCWWSGAGGGAGGESAGVALLVAGGAGGGGVLLDGSLHVLPSLLGGVCACCAGQAAPCWPRCRGGRLLSGHLGRAVVRRRWAAAGGRCSQAGVSVEGASGGGGVLRVGPGAIVARACPPRVYGAHGGPNVVGPCSRGGSWCWTVWWWWRGCPGCVWYHSTGGNGGKGWWWW